MTPTHCKSCDVPIAPVREWKALEHTERAQHAKDRTLARHMGRGLCTACYQAKRRGQMRTLNDSGNYTYTEQYAEKELALTDGRWVPKNNGVLKWIPNRKEDAA